MPEYLAPGVYVEEISTGPKPIEGVGTSTAGFLGRTERGPENPRLMTSWLEFQRWYGSYLSDSYMAYAVKGFFDNGGQRCVIGRIVGAGATATSDDLGSLIVMAVGRGEWGDRIRIRVDAATLADVDAGSAIKRGARSRERGARELAREVREKPDRKQWTELLGCRA